MRRKGDAPGVSDLAFLQILDQLCQPTFSGVVIFENLGKGGVFQLVRKALPEGFPCPTSGDKKEGGQQINSHGQEGRKPPSGISKAITVAAHITASPPP